VKNLYTELAEYLKRPQVLVEARSIHASVELAWQFEEHKDNPIEHYKNTDLYLFGSTRYQMDLQFHGAYEWYQDIVKKYGWKNGLDIGGGIGEQTLLALEAGVEDMTFVEVLDSPTWNYAKWRFERTDFIGKIHMEENGYEINKDFDFVVAMDVFEHMEDPQPLIKKIAEHTKYLFCNPDQIKYNWLYPQHISHFTLEPYFKQVDLYFYERRQND
jgi:SAM-dependent methyltransferase